MYQLYTIVYFCVPIAYHCVPLNTIISHWALCPIVYQCVPLCTVVYHCVPWCTIVYHRVHRILPNCIKFTNNKIAQVFHEWGNYMQGPQTSAVRDIIQVAKKYFWGPNSISGGQIAFLGGQIIFQGGQIIYLGSQIIFLNLFGQIQSAKIGQNKP